MTVLIVVAQRLAIEFLLNCQLTKLTHVLVFLSFIFTARVRSTTGRHCFHRCLSVHRGGYSYPIMLCNISQNAMGQPGGIPFQVQPGGVPCQVKPGGYPGRGGTLAGAAGGVPCQVQLGGGTLARGVPWLGGYPGRGGTLAGEVPWLEGVPWPGGYPGRGGTLAGGYPGWGGYPGRGGYPVRTT